MNHNGGARLSRLPVYYESGIIWNGSVGVFASAFDWGSVTVFGVFVYNVMCVCCWLVFGHRSPCVSCGLCRV